MSRDLLPILDNPILESSLTLDVETSTGQLYRWAGANLTDVNGGKYDGRIIGAGSLRQAINQSADRVDLKVSNVDRLISTSIGSRVKFGSAVAGEALKRLRTGGWEWHQLLTGVLVAASANEREATFDLLSDVYAAGLVGATAPIQRKCRHVFNAPDPLEPNNLAKRKGPDCGYTGLLTTCNKIFESADGCAGRDNQHRYGGVLYDVSKESLILPPPDIGGDTGTGPGGNVNEDYKYNNWHWQMSY